MWDRLLVDCHIATMEPTPGNPLGLIDNGAVAIRRTGSSAWASAPNSPAFAPRKSSRSAAPGSRPGLVDCHTHLVFGGTRADEHAMRRAGATYEEIAKAGGGIASTVKRDRRPLPTTNCSPQPAAGSHALMRGGCTTVEIKSGYGLDPPSELRMLRCAASSARASRPDRPDPARAPRACPPIARTAVRIMSARSPTS